MVYHKQRRRKSKHKTMKQKQYFKSASEYPHQKNKEENKNG